MNKNLSAAVLAGTMLAPAASAMAAVPWMPTYWYWQVADTNPSTQVWEATSGSFVSNTSSNFTTWLGLVAAQPTAFGGLAQTICGAVNNGSNLIRISNCTGNLGFGGWATGQIKTVYGVGGVPNASGAWTITLVNQTTVDLQGSTFSGVFTSGGVIGSGSSMDTAADMNAAINTYNVAMYNAGASSGVNSINSGTSVTLTNPMAAVQQVTFTASAQTLTLPQMNLFGSIPIGVPIMILNTGSNTFQIVRSGGGGSAATVNVGEAVFLILTANASVPGTYTFVAALTGYPLPSALLPSGGVNCSGSPTSSFATVNGQVTHC